jgi:hypothetical protein
MEKGQYDIFLAQEFNPELKHKISKCHFRKIKQQYYLKDSVMKNQFISYSKPGTTFIPIRNTFV